MMPYEGRLELALDWLGKDNVTFVALYLDQLDSVLHKHGVSGEDIETEIRNTDSFLGNLRRSLENNGLQDNVNVIVTGNPSLNIS